MEVNAAVLPAAPSPAREAQSAVEEANAHRLERYVEARQRAIQLLDEETHLLQRKRDGMDRIAAALRPHMQASGWRVRQRYVRWQDEWMSAANIYDHEDRRQWFVTLVGRREHCGIHLHNVKSRYSFTLRQPVLAEGEEPLTIHHLNLHRSVATNVHMPTVAGPEEMPLERLLRKHRSLFSTTHPQTQVRFDAAAVADSISLVGHLPSLLRRAQCGERRPAPERARARGSLGVG